MDYRLLTKVLLGLLGLFVVILSFLFSEKQKKVYSKTSRKEKETCLALEKIFNKPFKKKRPNWLVNPETGRRLEIDCYNEELKIGAEFNGIQHYKWPNFTGQSYESFLAQQRRDNYKKLLCLKKGVKLIIVPYKIKEGDIENFIRTKILEN
jgi:hypothetical protein